MNKKEQILEERSTILELDKIGFKRLFLHQDTKIINACLSLCDANDVKYQVFTTEHNIALDMYTTHSDFIEAIDNTIIGYYSDPRNFIYKV